MHKAIPTRSIAAVLALLLATALPRAGAGSVDARAHAPAASATADVVIGAGPQLLQIACAMCVAAGLFFGGTSIILFAAFAVANPGPAGACIGACVVGFG